jgi:hypothetical protein
LKQLPNKTKLPSTLQTLTIPCHNLSAFYCFRRKYIANESVGFTDFYLFYFCKRTLVLEKNMEKIALGGRQMIPWENSLSLSFLI